MEQERVTMGYLLRRDEYRAVLRAERVAAGESSDTKRPRWVGTTVQLPGGGCWYRSGMQVGV